MTNACLKIRRRQCGMSTIRYTLFLLLAVLMGLEVVLRAFDPAGIGYLYDVRTYFKTMLVDDERFAYIHEANTEGELNGVPVRFNSAGLRGPEVAQSKPEGSTRLLVIGDSVVFGWGVAEQDMFANRLQRMFDDAGQAVDIVAAAAASWNTRTEFEYLRHVGIDFGPDALLLVIVPNDTDPKRDGGYTEVPREELFPPRAKQERGVLENLSEDFWRSAARRSYVGAYLKYFWQEYGDDGDGGGFDPASPQWRDAQLALDGIIDFSREHGIELIVYLYGSEAIIAANPILRLYDQHLASRGIKPLVAPDGLLERPELRISMIDSHLTPEGNRIMAEALYPELVKRIAEGVESPAKPVSQ